MILNKLFPFSLSLLEGAPASGGDKPPETPAEKPAETPAEKPKDPAANAPTGKDVPENAPEVKEKSSEEIAKYLEKAGEKPKEDKPEDKKPEDKKPEDKKPEEEWFDKDKGFKTKEDALKSYTNLQEQLRLRGEQQKDLDARLASIEKKGTLSDEDKAKQAQISKWKDDNKEAITFLKDVLKDEIQTEERVSTITKDVLAARGDWKKEFDKDESRKELWPVMEKIYQETNGLTDFQKNPFPAVEALAFHKEFPRIAEKIKTDAIEDYKKQVREAEEAEKLNKTEIPGGAKTPAGELDASKMSSTELGALLPREAE